jgi:hypothetical protein
MEAKIIREEKIKVQYSFGSEILENSIFRMLNTPENIIKIEAIFLFIIF